MPDRTPSDEIFSDALREGLRKVGHIRTLARGEPLFRQGEPGEFVFVVDEGLIEISVTSAGGRKSVLAHCGPGEVLGEISALDGKPRSADAVAVKPGVGRMVHRSELLGYLAGNPEAMQALIEALCARIRNASDRFATVAITHAGARLASCLLGLAEKWGKADADGDVTIMLAFSQSEIGALAGLARENVSRHLARLTRDGVLSVTEGIIVLHDMDALERMLEAGG